MTLPCLDPCTVTTDTAVNCKKIQPQPTVVQAAPQAQRGILGGFEHKTLSAHCRGALLGLSLSELLWTSSVLLTSEELGQNLFRGMAVRALVGRAGAASDCVDAVRVVGRGTTFREFVRPAVPMS